MKKIIIITLVTIIFIASGISAFAYDFEDKNIYKAKIISVEQLPGINDTDGYDFKVKLEIINKDKKGQVYDIIHPTYDNALYDIFVNEGDKVIVVEGKGEDGLLFYEIYDHYRMSGLIWLGLLFVATVIFVGKKQGVFTILTLLITISILIFIFFPLILKGYNPILIAVLCTIIITIIVIPIISGINKKAIGAILGTIIGVVIAGSISLIFGTILNINVYLDPQATYLWYLAPNLNANNILFATIIIGALGAVMDVAMSISSTINELDNVNYNLSFKDLYKSGMNVGKDLIGTMANTLILAYFSTLAFLVIVLLLQEGTNIFIVINESIIASEIMRSLAGSIGLILTIPVTAFIATSLKKKRE